MRDYSEIKTKLLLLKSELENNLILLKNIELMIEEKGKESINSIIDFRAYSSQWSMVSVIVPNMVISENNKKISIVIRIIDKNGTTIIFANKK